MEGLKSHHGIRDFLDETMILFDHIVQIFDLTDFYKTDQSCQHQQPIDILNAGIVGAAFIHDDFMREAVVVDGLLEERGSGHFIALFGQHEINGVAELVDGTVQVDPFSFDLNVRFIHPPGCRHSTFAFLASAEINGE